MIKSLESKNIEKTQENQKIDKKDKTYKNKGTEFLFKPTMDKNFTDNEYYKNTKSKNLMQSKMKEYQNMENYDHMYKNYQPYSQMEPKIKYWDKYNTDRDQYDLQSYRHYDKYMAQKEYENFENYGNHKQYIHKDAFYQDDEMLDYQRKFKNTQSDYFKPNSGYMSPTINQRHVPEYYNSKISPEEYHQQREYEERRYMDFYHNRNPIMYNKFEEEVDKYEYMNFIRDREMEYINSQKYSESGEQYQYGNSSRFGYNKPKYHQKSPMYDETYYEMYRPEKYNLYEMKHRDLHKRYMN